MGEREQRRLAELHEYQLLDTPPQEELETVVRVAAAVAGVPTATLNLIDAQRQYQLTTVGFPGKDCDRSDSMCAVRLDTGRFVNLPDARREPDYQRNPWVTGVLGSIVFYASAPLVTPGGFALGTLCVFDTEPHELTAEQVSRIEDLAAIVVAFFECRRHVRLTAALATQTEARKQWAEAVMDTIDVAVIAIDPAYRVTEFNRAARGYHEPDVDLEAAPVEVAARFTLYEPDGRTPVPDDQVPLVVALTGGGPVTGREMMIRRPDAEPRRVRANARALHSADGAVLGAVVALQDVTAEWSRRGFIDQARRRLAAANADLRRSNADLTNFAGAVSHDLVAPLAAVGGYLELLADEVDGRARGWVDAAARAVARMRDLIAALLDYARAGSAPVRRVRVPLGNLLDQVLLDMRAEIEAAGARVRVPGPLPVICCDPVLARQLLQNLIANAIKYRHPDRPCRVTVTAAAGRVSVADNGVGVPAEQRHRVFDMFTRLEPGAAAAGQGIGLSTCLRIVDRHGGSIRMEENADGGVTVVFALPEPADD
ncbi:sensor histidine kinase [Actinoplanes aureus]|uniref:Sensor-like histidine kinase SenX3 n=1 Tax=Actinoplanes aureus TaxID=2792083 RepID=A0A931CCC6_9ACTN|nr:ATP-binding protein [Actinoplanes aureus]MBG0567305.1 GAF domain-containing protein [Actinoplanes aureus]